MTSDEFLIDYAHGALGYRLTAKRVLHEPFAKVIDKDSWVLDATGGIIKDAIMMALLGCKVWTCEAHPLIARTVEKSLAKIKNHPEFSMLFDQERFRFFAQDSLPILEELSMREPTERPDIVYLDPMFESKQKSSIAKREMQWLQEIHASNAALHPHHQASSSAQVFTMARKVAQKRVVVKRALRAPLLVETPTPSFSKNFQSARFDVYLT